MTPDCQQNLSTCPYFVYVVSVKQIFFGSRNGTECMMSQMKKLKRLGYKDKELEMDMYESLGHCSGGQKTGRIFIFG